MFLIGLLMYGLLSFGTFFASQFKKPQNKKLYVTLTLEEQNERVGYYARLGYIDQRQIDQVLYIDQCDTLNYAELGQKVCNAAKKSSDGYVEIGPLQDCNICVMTSSTSLENIANLFSASTLVDNTKDSISQLLQYANKFQQNLLSRTGQIKLTQKTFPLLQKMIIKINDGKDMITDMKDEHVQEFLKDFKSAFSAIWYEEQASLRKAKKEAFITGGVCLLLCAFLYLEYAYQLNQKRQDFYKLAMITLFYIGFLVYDSPTQKIVDKQLVQQLENFLTEVK